MKFRYIVIICCSVVLASCGRPSSGSTEAGYSDTLIALVGKWQHYRDIGRQDSVIITGGPWLRHYVSVNDTVGVQYTGVSMAQAMLLVNADYDSVRSFINWFRPWFEGKPNPSAASVYWNTMGHYALKYELDYAESLSCYLKALEYARSNGDVNSQIVMLSNIVNIFYVRSDEHGDMYAEEALNLAESDSVMPFNKVAANIVMAQVRYLSEEPDTALEYLQKAHIQAMQFRISYYDPIIQMLYGDIFKRKSDYDRADACYAQALALSANAEPSLVSRIYLSYGDLCEDMRRYDEALDLYYQGLGVSVRTQNNEFRADLLHRLVSLLYKTGRDALAADFYRQYDDFTKDFAIENKNQAFGDRQLMYVQMRHEYEEMESALALSQSRRGLLVSVFVVVIAVISAVFFILLYLKQRRMYKEAVAKYEEYRRRLESENRKQESLLNSAHGENEGLYLRIEELMHSGAYRDKELSVEKLAEMLCSNRTYVSNTINTMAGCSFFKYVDTYRIKEATRILSDPALSAGVSLKALADDIGYSSPQVFHKAFKKETGVTPGVYRSEILKIKQ